MIKSRYGVGPTYPIDKYQCGAHVGVEKRTKPAAFTKRNANSTLHLKKK